MFIVDFEKEHGITFTGYQNEQELLNDSTIVEHVWGSVVRIQFIVV